MRDTNYYLLSVSMLIMTANINEIVNEGCKDLDATRLRLEAIRKEACETIQRLDKEAEFNE